MNFELMAKILIEKDNSKFTAELMKNMAMEETEHLIMKLDKPHFLKQVAFELEKDLDIGLSSEIVRLKNRGLIPASHTDKSISIEEYCARTESTVKTIIDKIYDRLNKLEGSDQDEDKLPN